jgi:hypothetical protein
MLANLLASFSRRDPSSSAAPASDASGPEPAPAPAPVSTGSGPSPFGGTNDLPIRDTISAGQLLIETLLAKPEYADPKRLEPYGWKAYSQTDEDGILQEIFRRIGVRHRTFVEFGCGFGLENNTAYLLSQGWGGLWMDGSEINALRVRTGFGYLIEHGLLRFSQSFITRDNIDGLIAAAALGPEIDLLSIDIDGNDYYVWDAVKSVNARVVVIEYNAKFRPPHTWCMVYNAQHEWRQTDHMGCSLAALAQLGTAKGYVLVGCSIVGGNAFFVRADLAGDQFATPATPEHLYQPARYHLTTAYQPGHIPSSLSIVEGAALAAQLPWPPAAPLPEVTFG